MKITKIRKINILIIMLTISDLFLTTNSATKASEEELKKEIQEISNTKQKSKLVACMSLLRNSLAEENNEIKNALGNSKFDKSKSFDKLILAILINCKSKIKDSEMESLLNPDNIISSHSNDQKVWDLLKFDKNILEKIELTEEELLIQKEIQEASEVAESDMVLIDEEIGRLGFKLFDFGRGLYIFILIAVAMIIIIVCGGLYMLLCKKKVVKDKSKKNN